jgi:Protein of unknown function (DUF3421)
MSQFFQNFQATLITVITTIVERNCMKIKMFGSIVTAMALLLSSPVLSTQAQEKTKGYEWVTGRRGAIPVSYPVPAGTDPDGSDLYVCRVETSNGIIPGKLSPKNRICYVPFNGKEVEYSRYKVLNATGWQWVKLTGDVPYNAIVGGNDIDGEPLYICSVGGAAGKYKASSDTCDVPYDGKELLRQDFVILVGN